MYKTAIKTSLNYTRPLLIGRLYYENKTVSNDITSMIVLNKNGDILTTAHNAEVFFACSDFNETYPPILKEINEAKPKQIKKIEEKYGINKDTIVGIHNIIIDVANTPGALRITKHPYLDLAIVSIENNKEILVKNFPVFAKNSPEIGTSICSVGFAIPEYKAFKYDEENYRLTSSYDFMNFPIFPTTGIICRNIADKEDKVTMFEMSNQVLSGQEGGPILDIKGHIVGMTTGFRIINDLSGQTKLGIGIRNDAIMQFLDDNNIEYEVAKWII